MIQRGDLLQLWLSLTVRQRRKLLWPNGQYLVSTSTAVTTIVKQRTEREKWREREKVREEITTI